VAFKASDHDPSQKTDGQWILVAKKEDGMTIATYTDLMEYHPNRVQRAFDRLHEHFIAFRGDFDGTFATTVELLEEWSEGRFNTPQDNAMLEDGGWLEEAFEIVAGQNTSRSFIVDARSILGSLDDDPVDASVFDEFPRVKPGRNGDSYYVHFGDGVFASPFPGTAVDGAYVNVRIEPGRNTGMAVSVTLVCSDPYRGVVPDSDNRSAGIRLMEIVRSITLDLNPEDTTDFAWDANLNLAKSDDPNDRQWAPLARAPMEAALKIMRSYFTKSIPTFAALPAGTPQSVVRLFENATNDAHWRTGVDELEKGAAVQYLGSVPNSTPPCASARAATSDQVEAMINDAFDMDSYESGLLLAQRAAKLADLVDDGSITNARVRAKSLAATAQFAILSANKEVALEASEKLAKVEGDYAKAYLPIAWLGKALMSSVDEAEGIQGQCEELGAEWAETIYSGLDAIERFEECGLDPKEMFREHQASVEFDVYSLSNLAFGTKNDLEYRQEWHLAAMVTDHWSRPIEPAQAKALRR
jgi:hypothetical protein